MHKINTRFVEFIVYYWSISDRLINSINIFDLIFYLFVQISFPSG